MVDGMTLADGGEGGGFPAPERFGDAHTAVLNFEEDSERSLPVRDGFGLAAFGPKHAGDMIFGIATIGIEFEGVLELGDGLGGSAG